MVSSCALLIYVVILFSENILSVVGFWLLLFPQLHLQVSACLNFVVHNRLEATLSSALPQACQPQAQSYSCLITMGGGSAAALLLLLTVEGVSAYKPPLSSWKPPTRALLNGLQQPQQEDEKDLLSKCKLHWRNATLDHFTWV